MNKIGFSNSLKKKTRKKKNKNKKEKKKYTNPKTS